MHRLVRSVIALAVLAFVVQPPAIAQPTQPLLRIETGQHEAFLRSAAADAAGRVLVTGSDDRTARVWSLPDLRPLGVLRPPSGEGDLGKVYAVAVSPDGRLAAIGGWLGSSPDDAVILFDLATRQVVRRIGGLPNVAHVLAFSPDGARLAAGLGGANGMRVWRVVDGAQVAADTDYGDRVYGLSFAPDGRLGVGSFDGALRLYGPDGTRRLRVATEAGERPFRVSFSRDGRAIAVGFDDKSAVEVRDGASLALRTRPDVTGLDGAVGLERVAWSSDGQTLYAGGDPWVGSGRPVFVWPRQGAGPRRIATEGFEDGVGDLVILPGDRLVHTSMVGDIGIAGPDGRRTAVQRPVRGDLTTATTLDLPSRRLRLSVDGRQAEWVTYNAPSRWLRFDAGSGELASGAAPSANLADWQASAPGLSVTNWGSSTSPALNDRPLTLRRYEQSRSVAVQPGRALLGTGWALRLFGPDGVQRWEQPAPGTAWRVNQSGDGRLAVAAYGDGTIRWHRMSDGRELLALFVTEDAQRWVAFTPGGYFLASPGAEDLIGWHLNRRPDQAADFFPVGRFRDRFYRPDIVTRVLTTLDEDAAIRAADAVRGITTNRTALSRDDLPPVITILDPRDGASVPTNYVRLRYRVRSPSGRRLTALTPTIDGQAPGLLLPTPLPVIPGADRDVEGSIDLPIPPGETVTVALAASDGRDGQPDRIRITSLAKPPDLSPGPGATPLRDPGKPRLRGVLVGVAAYPRTDMKLNFAGKDAIDVAAAFERQDGPGGRYREVALMAPLVDARATRAGVMRALSTLRADSRVDDVSLVYLSGHGIQYEGRTFFLPFDGDPNNPDATAISKVDLIDMLGSIRGKVVVMLDICHAGAFADTLGPDRRADSVGFAATLRDKPGLIVFTSSSRAQPSVELPDLRNGAFTAALLRGLKGEAAIDRGLVTVDDLDTYITFQVRRLTQGRQDARMTRHPDIRDFPLYATIR